MALCTSCGSEVADSASFCTSCGKRLPAATQPLSAVTVTRPVCSACGAEADPGSVFCTNCGKRLGAAPAPEVAQTPTVNPETASRVAPQVHAEVATPSSAEQPDDVEPRKAEPSAVVGPAAPMPVVTKPVVVDATPQESVQRSTVPVFTASGYASAQPRGGAFRLIVVILLLVIAASAFGGWYFWGVETVIVCSPPDAQVFLDHQVVTPASYGRYVVPHLSRKPHMLRVQLPGYADVIQRIDSPLSSSREWINITLPKNRPIRQPR